MSSVVGVVGTIEGGVAELAGAAQGGAERGGAARGEVESDVAV